VRQGAYDRTPRGVRRGRQFHLPELNPFFTEARPHPGPMASQARHELVAPQEFCAPRTVVPQERVKHLPYFEDLLRSGCGARPVFRRKAATATDTPVCSESVRHVLPLLGERAGERAGVNPDTQKSPQVRISPPESALVRLSGRGGRGVRRARNSECGVRNWESSSCGAGSQKLAFAHIRSHLFFIFSAPERASGGLFWKIGKTA
jgi:hypothetical protein